jgi:hypothetical protein
MAWKRLQFQCMYQDSELNHSMKNGQWKILRKDRLLYLASSKLPHKLSNRGSRMSCIVHPTHPQQVQFHLAEKKRRTRSSPREVLLLEWDKRSYHLKCWCKRMTAFMQTVHTTHLLWGLDHLSQPANRFFTGHLHWSVTTIQNNWVSAWVSLLTFS